MVNCEDLKVGTHLKTCATFKTSLVPTDHEFSLVNCDVLSYSKMPPGMMAMKDFFPSLHQCWKGKMSN